MHGHVLRHLCFVSSFIGLNRGGRARDVVVVPSRRMYIVVLHRLRSFIIIYLSVDSSLTTWLVSDNTKHAGCRCEQSLSILISFQVEPPSPWICPSSFEESKTRARRKPSGLELIRFPVLGLPILGRTATLGISRAFPNLSFTCLFPFLSLPSVRSDRCWEAQLQLHAVVFS
jgi:hypothetical protein